MNETVSAEWLHQHLHDQDLVILDASLKSTVSGVITDTSADSIPNARFMDMERNFSHPNSSFPNTVPTALQFEQACRKLGINQSSKIVVFDNLGVYYSPRAWWMFQIMGHRNIAVLNGGLPEWTRLGYSTKQNKAFQGKPGDFKAAFREEYVVSYQDILSNTEDPSFVIVDARSQGRFDGTEKEPRKHLKSGHIPNSINIPYTEVLENGKFKSEKALWTIFNDQCQNRQELVFSCGSGLTACIVMMASEMAYRKSKRVYDGSWTEWAELQNLKEN